MSRRVRFTSVPKAIGPYLDTWDSSFFELGADAHAIAPGRFELPATEVAAGCIAVDNFGVLS